jgi:hypothetical protein
MMHAAAELFGPVPIVFASMFSGDTLDTVADYIAIFVLLFVPALLIYLFWMVHILPEKIAERRGHPQADAIKTLCLLSLVFGGLLWPIAWLWAYSKPVFYKMAYGKDVVHHHEASAIGLPETPDPDLELKTAVAEPATVETGTPRSR